MCPPVRRADTQVGPYTRPPIDKRPRRPKWVVVFSVIAFAFALCGAVAQAQQTGKIPRIGYLDNSTASSMAVLVDALRQELSKLGWVEGKNIIIGLPSKRMSACLSLRRTWFV